MQNTNFYRTLYQYDKRGRLERTVSPAGTISRTVYDFLGRAVSEWVGTNDTPASGFWSPTNNTAPANMVKVREVEYDGGLVGDGNATKSTSFPGGGAANRVSQTWFDWRNRAVASKGGVEASESTSLNRPLTYTDLDNLGQATQTRLYDGDTISLVDTTPADGVPDAPAATALRGQSKAYFDELGRAYLTESYGVDPVTFVVSTNALKSNTWFDKRGQVAKSSGVGGPGGLVSKATYDGVGRVTASYVSDGGGDATWADAFNVTGDTVLEQGETTYDADSRVLVSLSRQRFHTASGTGALGTASTGVLARVSYNGFYYDVGDRLTDTVDVGTNAAAVWTRPATVPARSDTVLVGSTAFDSAGRAYQSTDPRGLVSRLYFDDLGRTTKSIQNYVNGIVSDVDDKTVEYEYSPAGQTKLRVKLTGGGEQTTETVYGVSQTTGDGFDAFDVAKKTKQPDPSTGLPSATEVETITLNAIGEVLTSTDRNGTVHTFAYDVVGRPISDAVTTLGAGVNNAVLRLETAYDGQQNAYLFTSYNLASAGTVVNQVQRDYNGLGQLTIEYQNHNGVVNTGTSLKTQYAYSWAPTGSTNHSRLTQITYPNAQTVNYAYAAGLNDNISRLTGVSVAAQAVEGYNYMGLGTVIERTHTGTGTPNVDLSYVLQGVEAIGDAGDIYTGLDRFGRVINQRWRSSVDNSNRDRYSYAYYFGQNADTSIWA